MNFFKTYLLTLSPRHPKKVKKKLNTSNWHDWRFGVFTVVPFFSPKIDYDSSTFDLKHISKYKTWAVCKSAVRQERIHSVNTRPFSVRDHSPDINEPAPAIIVPLVVFYSLCWGNDFFASTDLILTYYFMNGKVKIALGSKLLLCKERAYYIFFYVPTYNI